MYSSRGITGSRLVNVARSDRYCFRDSKAAACSKPQAKYLAPRNVLRNGKLCSADLEINMLSHPGFGAPRPGREHNHQVCWDQVSHI
jgi:hypothetical protein